MFEWVWLSKIWTRAGLYLFDGSSSLIIIISQGKHSRKNQSMQGQSRIQRYQGILNLQMMDLNQIFQYAKRILNCNSSKQFTDQKKSQQKSNLKKIYTFVINKIEGRQKLQLRQFIGLISILSYLNVIGKQIGYVSKVKKSFYKKTAAYINQLAKLSKNNGEAKYMNNLKLSLSTLLYALISLIKSDSQGEKEKMFDLEAFFNPQVIQALLKIQFPDDQKLMKHYKNLMLYFSKLNLVGFSKLIMIRSLSYHLANCKVSKQTQIATIYILNNIFNNKNALSKMQTIWVAHERIAILKSLFELLGEVQNEYQCSLIIQFSDKIMKNTNSLELLQQLKHNMLDMKQFFKIYNNVFKQIKLTKRLNYTFEKMIINLSGDDRFNILKIFWQEQNPSIGQLQVMEACSKNLSEPYLLKIIEQGFCEKLVSYFKSFKNQLYQKYLLSKILDNIIKSSEVNADVKAVVQNLLFYCCPTYLFKTPLY